MMRRDDLVASFHLLNSAYTGEASPTYKQPVYDPQRHYLDIAHAPYYKALVDLRHVFKAASDHYWGTVVSARNVDLFMLTPSISSPMGPGSDSEAIRLQFGNLHTYLVDSSQFGFEPILLNGHDKVYCYLPSMRGENPDERHLNQFYHCEAEIRGTLHDLFPLVEQYIKFLVDAFVEIPDLVRLMSTDASVTELRLQAIQECPTFRRMSFDEAVNLLQESGNGDWVRTSVHGRDLSQAGEIELLRILGSETPVWIENFDRDRVAFYQKPDPTNPNRVINADLLFPPLIETSFGGEIVGAGQRQDTQEEMYESLRRQGVNAGPYEWYIQMRTQPMYKTSSGFGLGVERFLAWLLCKNDIKDVILYPRLKNVATIP